MKRFSALLGLLLAITLATPVFADSTISGLNSGGTVQTQDQIPVYRPSSPGTNFKVIVGSAATQSIGTSGPAVPLLSTTNTWSGLQSFLSGDLTAADPVFTGGSLLLPAGTTSQRPGSPVNGMIRYNSTTPGVEGYVNGAWGPLGGSSTSGITALTGDLTASGSGSVASTLATVNANVGTFGSASAVPQITIDAKGRITSSASVAITPSAIGAAPLASPIFTGTVTAPVIVGALAGNASTSTALAATPTQCSGSQFATGITASGTANCATPSGTGSGVSTFNTRAGAVVPATGDYTVSQVTGAAPLASPTFTGPVNGSTAVWSSTDTALNFAATGSGADTVPVGTTAQRPGSPAAGMLRYNSDSTAAIEAYIGGAWQKVVSATNGLVNLASQVTGNLPLANGGTGYSYPTFYPKLLALKTGLLGTTSLRVCSPGDSTTFGVFSNGQNSGDYPGLSYPSQMALQLMQQYGIPAHQDAWMGDQGSFQTLANDTRVTIGSSWAQDTSSVTIGGYYIGASTSTNSLDFTPTNNVDSFRVIYQTQSGNGVLSAQIDGGAVVPYATGTGTSGNTAVVIAAGSVGAHTLHLKWVSGGNVRVAGTEAYDSTTPSVSVINAGWSGSRSTDWNVTTNAWSPANAAAWNALGCDLTLWDLGINDWDTGPGPTGTSAYQTNMQALITASQSSGDVALLSPVPTNPGANSGQGATNAVQATYLAVLNALKTSNNIPYINNYGRWGSFAKGAANFLYGDTFTHPNAAGYGDFAAYVLSNIIPASWNRNNYGQSGNFLNINTFYPNAATLVQPVPTATFSSNNTVLTEVQLTNSSSSGQANIFYGGSQFAGYFGTTDVVANKNFFSANGADQFQLQSVGVFSWNSSAQFLLSVPDTGISRLAAGSIAIGNGTTGNSSGSASMTNLTLAGKINFAAARKGTFICTAGGTITIANANEALTSDVIVSLNTAGGTISTPPAMKSVTAGTGFTELCGAADTSTYNYNILN